MTDSTKDNNYAIRSAAQNGDYGRVRALLEDPRVNPSDMNNQAVLLASQNGHASVVRMLLSDFRVDRTLDYNIAIQLASQNGHTDVIKELTDPIIERRRKPHTPKAAH